MTSETASTLSAPPDIAANLADVQARVAEAARGAGRDPAAVTLVAVGKTFAAERMEPALDAGQRVFGENRVQEAEEKWPPLRDRFPDLSLHLIGPLQSNKVRKAVEVFDVIETVDRPKLARALAPRHGRNGPRGRLFYSGQYGGRGSKGGDTSG